MYINQYMTDSSHLQSRTWDITNQTHLPPPSEVANNPELLNRNTTPEDKVNTPPTKHNYLSPSKIANNGIVTAETPRPKTKINYPTGNNVTSDVSTRPPTYSLTDYSLQHIFNECCE
jgi:hypothetical protein